MTIQFEYSLLLVLSLIAAGFWNSTFNTNYMKYIDLWIDGYCVSAIPQILILYCLFTVKCPFKCKKYMSYIAICIAIGFHNVYNYNIIILASYLNAYVGTLYLISAIWGLLAIMFLCLGVYTNNERIMLYWSQCIFINTIIPFLVYSLNLVIRHYIIGKDEGLSLSIILAITISFLLTIPHRRLIVGLLILAVCIGSA